MAAIPQSRPLPPQFAMAGYRRSAPFDRSRPTSAQSQAEERADYSRSAMGLLSTMVMSRLLRRLDVPVAVRRTPSAVTSPARICAPRCWNSDDPFSRRGRRLSAARPGTMIELRRAGGRSQSRVLRGYGSPAPWEADAGQARLAQLSRCGMTTLVLTSVEAAENMAIAPGKGAKTQKIGLKEQAPALVQRISHSVSLQSAVGVTAARRRARGEDSARKPAARPCRRFLCPTPPGRDAGGRRPRLLQRPLDSAAPPDP